MNLSAISELLVIVLVVREAAKGAVVEGRQIGIVLILRSDGLDKELFVNVTHVVDAIHSGHERRLNLVIFEFAKVDRLEPRVRPTRRVR